MAPTDGAYIGASVPRREDGRLLTGGGRFVDDIDLPGMLHVAILRSPHGHAVIDGYDTGEAEDLPGVMGVFTPADLPELDATIPPKVSRPGLRPGARRAIATDKVRYVGEPVAAVVATSRYVAEDARESVSVDYRPLPASASIPAALREDAARVHDEAPGNVAIHFRQQVGDVEEALARAPHRLTETLEIARGGGHSMEGRGVVAYHDRALDQLVLWDATQVPHHIRSALARLLGLDEERIRVVAPADVGGGFGPKTQFYGEEAILAALARRLEHPLKWVEDREEHFVSATMERTQIHDVEVGFDDGGRVLALRDEFSHDQGAYCLGLQVPLITLATIPGPYRIPAMALGVRSVLTNLPPTASVRGAGRPQAVFVMERMLDRIARHLDLPPEEVRRRNLVPADAFPYHGGLTYRDGSPLVYDSGNYQALLEGALQRIDVAAFREEQQAARQEGRRLGLGMAFYVEGTGLGPFESARVAITAAGRVCVTLGAPPQGQGYETVYAQIAADGLGADIDTVDVRTGDTAAVALSIGTFASRVTATAGPSVWLAARDLRDKVLHAGGILLERDASDLEIHGGQVRVRGDASRALSFAELSAACDAGVPGVTLPAGIEPGLHVERTFAPEATTYASGVHMCTVEVDAETGTVEILRYVVGEDCGRVINPALVRGQTIGGLAHGIGNALLEQMHYDDSGQPSTTSYLDYPLPAAVHLPPVEVFHVETPSTMNPLGVKGTGEAGTIPAPAALAGAVEDALTPEGVRISRAPVTAPALGDLLEHAAGPAQASAGRIA